MNIINLTDYVWNIILAVKVSFAKITMRESFSATKHHWWNEQWRYSGHRRKICNFELWCYRNTKVWKIYHSCWYFLIFILSSRPTITWKREDGEKIRLCEHHFTEDDKCNEVDEYIGDSLTLININRLILKTCVESLTKYDFPDSSPEFISALPRTMCHPQWAKESNYMLTSRPLSG